MSAHDDNGQQLTDVELRDQLVSLLLLGYETTAAALGVYLIHSSPEVLKAASRTRLPCAPEPEVITRLPSVSNSSQETLRIYPIGLICVPRMVKEPMQVGGYEFDIGTVLVPCILAHRPEVPEPGLFK